MEGEVVGRACSEAGGAVCKGSCGRVRQAVEQGESGQVGRVEVIAPQALQRNLRQLKRDLCGRGGRHE